MKINFTKLSAIISIVVAILDVLADRLTSIDSDHN